MLLRVFLGLVVVVAAAAMDVGVQEGGDHTFQCDFPIPSGETYTVYWYKGDMLVVNYLSVNDAPVFTGDLATRGGVELTDGKDLAFENLQIADGGEYYCTVSVLGSTPTQGEGTHYQLMVFVPPSLTITGGPYPYELGEGESMTSTCRANSHPTSNFTWTLPNGDVSEGAVLEIKNMTLADAGMYRCTANNGYGSAYETVQITMKEKVIGGSDVMRVQSLPVMLLLLASLLLPVFLS